MMRHTGITLRAAGPGKFPGKLSDLAGKIHRIGIHDHLAQPRIGRNGNVATIDHHHFSARAGREQRPHQCRPNLAGATGDQNAKAHVLPFSGDIGNER